jgi:hypothetical protein
MIRKLLLLLVLIGLIVAGKAYHDTMRDPVVQRATIISDSMDPQAAPVTIALIADIHVAGPDMPPSRVERIVAQVNALGPDMVAIAGDLVSEKRVATRTYSAEQVVAPLAALEAPLGTVVVPGNHDHWSDWAALRGELDTIETITVLENEAAQFGPLVIGGIDDAFVDRSDVAVTMAQMAQFEGARVVLTHSPDIFPDIPVDVDLVMAGHTHCGQIAYPWGGAPATMSDYGELYSCGMVEQHQKVLITSAGLGTSLIPVRLFTQPEIWLIEIRPAAR